jgi:hypothetical protein
VLGLKAINEINFDLMWLPLLELFYVGTVQADERAKHKTTGDNAYLVHYMHRDVAHK